MKQVQIDQELFADIVRLVVFGQEDLRPSVTDRLKNKVDRMAARQRYREHLGEHPFSDKNTGA